MYWGFYVTGALLGLIIGSFLNVVIYRGPTRWGLLYVSPEDQVSEPAAAPSSAMNHDSEDDRIDRGGFARPRSYCPNCKTTIPPRQLIPVVSYLAQNGKCANCAAPISKRYPIVEILGAVITVAALARYGVSVEAFLASVFGWTLLALAAIDAETGFLPDALTFPLIAGGVAFNTVDLLAPWPAAIIGAIAGYGVFWAIGKIYLAVRKREGLAGGDAKLLAGIGAWAGWQVLPAVVFLGSVGTLAAIAAMSVVQKTNAPKLTAETAVKFGPGLAGAGYIMLLMGPMFGAPV